MKTNGLLLVDKPAEWTSFDVVNKIRRMCGEAGFNTTGRKRYPVGHTGTLDPLATGLLVILVGTYTKKAPALTKLDKTYEVTMQLGETSTTGDAEGEKTAVSDRQPASVEVQRMLESFVGDSLQTPPAFSAIKVNGQRAYNLARQGKPVELASRPIHIESITMSDYTYPVVQFIARVSSGTYIRSLVEDIGANLETGAYMSALRRTRVGMFTLDRAVTMASLSPETIAAHLIDLPAEPSKPTKQ